MSHNVPSYLEPLQEAGFPVAFVPRVEGVAGSYDKDTALAELQAPHEQVVEQLGYSWSQLWRAEQVHSNQIAMAGNGPGKMVAKVDGLMTAAEKTLLGIYVADCGLIWIADRRTRAIALLHSGRKGTEGAILSNAVEKMKHQFNSHPADLLVVLGPCIRPPHYEVDIAEMIAQQAKNAGVGDFLDSGICTGSNREDYYSYRMEKGLTGRMLGLIGR